MRRSGVRSPVAPLGFMEIWLRRGSGGAERRNGRRNSRELDRQGREGLAKPFPEVLGLPDVDLGRGERLVPCALLEMRSGSSPRTADQVMPVARRSWNVTCLRCASLSKSSARITCAVCRCRRRRIARGPRGRASRGRAWPACRVPGRSRRGGEAGRERAPARSEGAASSRSWSP